MLIQDYYRQHRKPVTLAGIAFIALVTVGMIMRSRSNGARYLSAAVTRGDITAVVEATGTINPLTTVPVGSYVSGTVEYIFADFNSPVHAGQVLAQLDPAINEAQVMQARGNLANAQANVQNLQASLVAQQAAIETNQANVAKLQAAAEYARVNARRIEDLAKEGVLSADQRDLTLSSMQQADAQVRAAQAQRNQSVAQLNQTRAQLRQAQAQVEVMSGVLKQAGTNLRYTTILSPIDGTVVARNITVGQSVAASLQAPNVFTVAQDLKRMQVYAATDESDTGNIKIGTEATFQVDAFPNETFRGRVSAIRLNATIVQNVVTYNTIVDFENPQEKLLPGETAYVTIPTGHASDCLEIPNAALRFTPELARNELQALYKRYHIPAQAVGSHRGGWQVVWKRGPGGKLQPLAVRTGITDYNHTQLLEGDVKQGDALVTSEELSSSAAPSQFPGNQPIGRGRR